MGYLNGGPGTFEPPVLYDETTALPYEKIMAFLGAGVTATDDPASGRTRVTIPGGVTLVASNSHAVGSAPNTYAVGLNLEVISNMTGWPTNYCHVWTFWDGVVYGSQLIFGLSANGAWRRYSSTGTGWDIAATAI